MSNTKHTPGPWNTVYIQEHGHIIRDRYNNKIADVVAINSGESIPNAKLIAVAPELLDLAKVLLKIKNDEGTFRYSNKEVCRVYNLLEEIIDVAEGRRL